MQNTFKQTLCDCTLNNGMGILYPIFKLHNDYSARTPEWSGL